MGTDHVARERLRCLAAHLQSPLTVRTLELNPVGGAEMMGRAPNAEELAKLRERSRRAWEEHIARPAPSAPFTSWVQGTQYDDSGTDRRVEFDTHGFLRVRNFAPQDECKAMLDRMHDLVDGWDPVGELVGFNTRAKEQLSEQGSSDYFLDSADRIHFFAELGAIDETTGGLVEGLSKQRALNKVGHGLHLLDDVFRAYAQAPRMRKLLRELGWRAPVLPQSMYIFKQPLIGGESTSHQDSGFLYTTPRQTCIGIWLALHPATMENGLTFS